MLVGAKPFECPHCEKKFRTVAHRKSHVMQHFKDGEVVKDRVRERRRRIKHGLMGADVPLQEPILITDTGLYTGFQLRESNRKIIFLFLVQNISCGYSKEPSQ